VTVYIVTLVGALGERIWRSFGGVVESTLLQAGDLSHL
jgi:hypothetical protein